MSGLSHALVRRGLNLMAVGTPETTDRALALFDEAIAIRSDPFDLAGAWMNRAEALLSRDQPGDALAAVAALDQAVPLLEPLLPGDSSSGVALVLRRLAVAFHNRALARRRCGGRERWQVIPDLLRAIELLERPAARDVSDRVTLLAAAWASLAEAQLAEPTEDAWERAVESATQAVELLVSRQSLGPTAAAIHQQAHDVMRSAARRLPMPAPRDGSRQSSDERHKPPFRL